MVIVNHFQGNNATEYKVPGRKGKCDLCVGISRVYRYSLSGGFFVA